MTPAAVAVVASFAAWADPTAEEFVIPGRTQAYRLAVRFEAGGRPLGAARAAALNAMFADLDRDGSGALDPREAGRAPSALRVRQLGWGYLFAAPAAAPWAALDADRDGAVTRAELLAYYRREGAAGAQVVAGTAPPPGPLTAALERHLDADRDGTLAEREWRAAADALQPLDADDDELIRPDELVPRAAYPGVGGGLLLPPGPGPATAFPVIRLPADRSDVRWASRLAGTADPLAWRSRPADGSAVVRPDGAAGGDPFPFGDVRVWAYPAPGRLTGETADAHRAARARFADADADRDGSVSGAEAAAGSYAPLRDHHAAADRDGDGRLAAAEWETFLSLRAGLTASAITVTILDHGPGLFELLDADADGALSVRELRGAWDRLTVAGCVREGAYSAAALPGHVRFVVSLGPPRSLVRPPPRGGPDWVRAADRNRDGDVSRREFPGPAGAFRSLDRDGDGLIDAREAEGAAPARPPGR